MKVDRRTFLLQGVGGALVASTGRLRAAEPASVNLEVDASAAAAYDFTALRKLMADAVERKAVPGCSLLLIHGDRVIFKEAQGWANIEDQVPFRVDTVCRLASSTKWITGATLAAAAEDGKLSLDDTIGKHYPQLADLPVQNSTVKGNPTLRQCFSHTAGCFANATAMGEAAITLQESVRRIAGELKQLRAVPGTDFLYGNISMQIAGAATEAAVGKPYEKYLRERLLDPLGMHHSSFLPTEEQIRRVATVYQPNPAGGLAVMLPPQQTHQLPVRPIIAGGMYSTLDDYARFLLMNRHQGTLGGKQVLKPETVRVVVSDQTRGVPVTQTPYLTQKGYGLGVATVEVDSQSQPTVIADGGAFGTQGWIDYQTNLLGVFFTAMQLRSINRLVQIEIPNAARATAMAKANP